MLSIKTQLWINWEKMYVIFHSKSLNKHWAREKKISDGNLFGICAFHLFTIVCVWLSVWEDTSKLKVLDISWWNCIYSISFWGFFGAYVNGSYGFNTPVLRTQKKQIEVVIRGSHGIYQNVKKKSFPYMSITNAIFSLFVTLKITSNFRLTSCEMERHIIVVEGKGGFLMSWN